MGSKILVVEDDPGISLSIKDEFESEGYDVCTAMDGEKALEEIHRQHPDLIILDIMLPKLDGYEVCRKLRAGGDHTPIIMLTVRNKEIDKVLGLELGADDYVTKPFSLRELLARVKANLRRADQGNKAINRFSIGKYTFDCKSYEACEDESPVYFTPLEFHILKLLYENKGAVITREDFLNKIWGVDSVVITDRTVDSHIANIRKKIEKDPSNPRYIQSIRGVGYKLVD